LSALFLLCFSSSVSFFDLIDNIEKVDIIDLESDFSESLLFKDFKAWAVSL